MWSCSSADPDAYTDTCPAGKFRQFAVDDATVASVDSAGTGNTKQTAACTATATGSDGNDVPEAFGWTCTTAHYITGRPTAAKSCRASRLAVAKSPSSFLSLASTPEESLAAARSLPSVELAWLLASSSSRGGQYDDCRRDMMDGSRCPDSTPPPGRWSEPWVEVGPACSAGDACIASRRIGAPFVSLSRTMCSR